MDREETLGSVWLGLTVGCARCHNHKYDQFTQKEYYQLFAYFNNGDESSTNIPRSQQALADFTKAKKSHESKAEDLTAKITKRNTTLKKQLPMLEKTLRDEIANRKSAPVKFHSCLLYTSPSPRD